MAIGRPPIKYTEEIGLIICDRVANGDNLDILCGEGIIPTKPTVYKWLRQEKSFFDEYTHAREMRAHSRNEEIDKILRELREGKISADTARVMIDARKWQAGKESPKNYGDRMTLAGDKENPLNLLAVRLDEAIQQREKLLTIEAPRPMIDITPVEITDDGRDLF